MQTVTRLQNLAAVFFHDEIIIVQHTMVLTFADGPTMVVEQRMTAEAAQDT